MSKGMRIKKRNSESARMRRRSILKLLGSAVAVVLTVAVLMMLAVVLWRYGMIN